MSHWSLYMIVVMNLSIIGQKPKNRNIPPQDVNPIRQQFIEFMQRMTQPTQPQHHGVTIDKNYEVVRRQGAKVFIGATDPAEAEEWLRNTERVLDRIECTVEQKLKYAVSLLEKDALDWWETIPRSRDREITLTWDEFLREFAEKYTPPIYRNRKKVEFLELKQNNLSVADYELQFVVRIVDLKANGIGLHVSARLNSLAGITIWKPQRLGRYDSSPRLR
ncbi:UNVERIFIED_CONTAM: hypothetical protein Sradi_2050600 [Sesamum radiatum]|uniref:Retrotransposon gag domain-containing protein n=1 Tax=Sesamum radiatum TaxID=300843 RepID=A0AAW2TGS2_SESRA